MKITENKIKQFTKIQDAIDTRVREIFDNCKKYELINEHKNNWTVDDWSISGDTLYINYSESWAYGGYDSSSTTVPTRYLWDDNYEAEMKAEYDKKQQEKEAREEAEAQKKLEAKQKQDLADYERLKKQFEDKLD